MLTMGAFVPGWLEGHIAKSEVGCTYVTQLRQTEDEYERVIRDPTWDDIEQAIQLLNGDTISETALANGDDVPYMGVAGGGESGYIVFVMHDDTNSHNLVDQSKSRDEVMLVAGGQMGSFEERHCVDLKTTLQAAKVYAETGTLDPSLYWEEA